jgi:hypothetical protein
MMVVDPPVGELAGIGRTRPAEREDIVGPPGLLRRCGGLSLSPA